ncbi:virulence factor Mce family protein [Nocardia otitidiscaviarum]|uniref:Virulence factor Mce family protein n=1 Tax=Nocardia otitidiscaviarum TaxID=1823 RepID=A0A379JGV7_9NOCA|nr:MlaD family protein [Nocardia otitidiscaviarum]SUD47700.1 virulence factor Mce family protein [Nocardia otitidiscaviarum]
MPTMTRLKDCVGGRDAAGREVRWGIAGAVVLVVALAASAALYVLPVGRTTYTALLSEAGAVRVGDDVRVAGITVGAVTAVDLLADEVRMRFTVDDEVPVGDASSLEIRMLTAVGGHYVALSPAGSTPLGTAAIPADRVRLPYSLMRVFQDATTPLERVDGGVVRENLTALESALSGHPDSLRRIGDTVLVMTDLLDRQRADIDAALTVASEYLGTIDAAKSTVAQLFRHINAVETILIDKRDEINAALPLTTRLLSRVAALEPAYRTTLQPLADEFARALPALRQLGQRLDQMIGTVGNLTDRLTQLAARNGVTVDQSGIVLTPVCVPLPGKEC